MADKTTLRLVIDANVAQSAGTTDHPVSRACRCFLQDVYSVCHKVVMTESIKREWKEHRSRFTRRWQASMTARKKVITLVGHRSSAFVSQVENEVGSAKDRETIEKDVHLIEAALETDRVVVSRDDRVRAILAGLCSKVKELRSITWVNPATEGEDAIDWLKSPSRSPKRFLLTP